MDLYQCHQFPPLLGDVQVEGGWHGPELFLALSLGERRVDDVGVVHVHGQEELPYPAVERLERMTAKIAREIASVDERLGDRLHLIDRDNDGIVDVEEIRDALAAIALRQNKFREDPEALEAFIQVAPREIDANSDDVITVEEVEKWFDSLEEEVEDQ